MLELLLEPVPSRNADSIVYVKSHTDVKIPLWKRQICNFQGRVGGSLLAVLGERAAATSFDMFYLSYR